MSHSSLDGSDYHGGSLLSSSIFSDTPAQMPFVGSPDHITADGEPSTPRGRRMSSLSNLPVQPRHQTPEQRSASYSTNHRSSTTNSVPRTPGSTRPSTGPLSSHAQHQWSLFGQVMENERQLRSSGAVRPGPIRTSSDHFSHLSLVSSVAESPTEEPSSDAFATRLSTHQQASSALDVYSEQESTADEEGSSEGSEEPATTTARVSRTAITRWIPSRVPTIPLLWKNMFKCSVAYFIGSLFTFHPPLSRFFGDLTSYGSGAGGPYPSAHLIATM
jgi:hypothetical protein